MPGLQLQLRADLNAARKAQDKPLTLLLGTVLADVENHHIALKRELVESDIIDVLRRAIKRRKESVEAIEQGGRAVLAAQERDEATALERYLPAQADEEEIRTAVRAAIADGATNMGAVMGRVTPAFKGRADGSTISRIVREELGPKA